MSEAVFPTLLEAATRVLDEAGVPAPTSAIATATRNSRAAVNALNDALEDIYTQWEWPWLRRVQIENLVPNQGDYPVPDFFNRLDGYLKIGDQHFLEKTPYEFERDIVQAPSVTNLYGVYGFFAVVDNVIRLSFIPNDAQVASNPTFQYTYVRGVPNRITADTDRLDLPRSFYRATVLYARSKVKQLLEYPDYAADMQEYEKTIMDLLRVGRKGFRQPVIKGPFRMGRSR